MHLCEIRGCDFSWRVMYVSTGRVCNVRLLPAITSRQQIAKSTDTHSIWTVSGWVVSEPFQRNKDLRRFASYLRNMGHKAIAAIRNPGRLWNSHSRCVKKIPD